MKSRKKQEVTDENHIMTEMFMMGFKERKHIRKFGCMDLSLRSLLKSLTLCYNTEFPGE